MRRKLKFFRKTIRKISFLSCYICENTSFSPSHLTILVIYDSRINDVKTLKMHFVSHLASNIINETSYARIILANVEVMLLLLLFLKISAVFVKIRSICLDICIFKIIFCQILVDYLNVKINSSQVYFQL